MKTKRKYLMEFCVNSYTTWGALLQQRDFERLKVPDGISPQIYCICRRPKITYDPASVKITDKSYEFDIVYQDGADTVSQTLTIPRKKQHNVEIKFDLQSPYTYVQLEEAGTVTSVSLATLGTITGIIPEKYRDLEILYIGQSLSDSPSYDIIERLKNHSTLQSIYSAALSEFPNYDIWIALFHFDCQQIQMIGGPLVADGKISKERWNYDIETPYGEEEKRATKILNSVDIDQQYINFTEAALIRYFEPPYNQKFKNTFPNPAHSSYSSCYDLDIHSVSATLAADAIESRVFSSKVEPNLMHLASFPLHTADDRRSFFDLLATKK